jgi:hypothetical protein
MTSENEKTREIIAPALATVKRLFALSANQCAFPKCSTPLVDGKTVVGEVCHIKAAKPGGARYDHTQAATERHGYENLILLCGTHHTVIDADEEAYTVGRLVKMKNEHERIECSMSDKSASLGAALLIDNSIKSLNQSGGITAQTVTIHNYPQTSEPTRTSVSPTVLPPNRPKITFAGWGTVSEHMQSWHSGFYLENHGEEAALEVQVQRFQIAPNVFASSGRVNTIGQHQKAFAWVWVEGFGRSDMTKWDLPAAMKKASLAKDGPITSRPDYKILIVVTYRDFDNQAYESTAELSYIPARGELRFGPVNQRKISEAH